MSDSTIVRRGRRAGLALIALVTLTATAVPPPGSGAAFAAENAAAMAKMMSGMDITPSGDIDRDFAIMMIAHHQGAIDMAKAELQFGSNEKLRRLAQGIVVEQQQEIAAMRLVIDKR